MDFKGQKYISMNLHQSFGNIPIWKVLLLVKLCRFAASKFASFTFCGDRGDKPFKEAHDWRIWCPPKLDTVLFEDMNGEWRMRFFHWWKKNWDMELPKWINSYFYEENLVSLSFRKQTLWTQNWLRSYQTKIKLEIELINDLNAYQF